MNAPTSDIRPPAGIRLLKLFYVLLFLLNAFFMLVFGRLAQVQVLGRTLAGPDDVRLKIILVLAPLIIFYLGFVRFHLVGCYSALFYQLLFFVNSALTLFSRATPHNALYPLLQIVKDSNPAAPPFRTWHILIYGFNLVFGGVVIYYLLSKISWYRNAQKGYGGHNERLDRRHAHSLNISYCAGGSGAAICTTAQSHNISKSGMRFIGKEPLKKGSVIELEITLPGQKEPLITKGRVTWTKGAESGIQFLKMSKFDRNRLEHFLKEEGHGR